MCDRDELEKIVFYENNLNRKVPMQTKQLIAKVPWMLTICIFAYFTSLYLTHDQPLPHDQWHYYINQQ